MASMKDIKRRRDSIQSTGQITKAMKLVSTVKLQKAKGKAESTKPYSDLMYDTICNMLVRSGNINHKYLHLLLLISIRLQPLYKSLKSSRIFQTNRKISLL